MLLCNIMTVTLESAFARDHHNRYYLTTHDYDVLTTYSHDYEYDLLFNNTDSRLDPFL
jgi:hypothetical protein